MRNSAFVLAIGVCLGAAPHIASAQAPGIPQLPPDQGWTTEDARREPRTPVLGVRVATVVRISVRPKTGRFIVTLDNGQRWSQIENKADVRLDIGDEIKLEKSTLGSYMLTTALGVQTRVKRSR
jgi:hypothetical protein